MRVVSRIHVGLVRDNNEDSLLVRPPYLFAVADGMGGYAAGEIASHATLKALRVGTHSLRKDMCEDDVHKILLEAFDKANAHVFKMARNNSSYTGMGTTMTALYIPGDGTAYCCHIGDSRLYLYRDGHLRQLTHDHTYVADLQEQGIITDEEAFVHPKRHMLLQAMGVEEAIKADSFHFALESEDKLLLCSDGLSDMLKNDEIEEQMADGAVEVIAGKLIERALDNGGRDNISLVLIDLAAEEEEYCNG